MLQLHLQLLIIDLSSKVLVFDDYRLNSDRPNEGRLDILRSTVTQYSETQRFTVRLLGNHFVNLRKTNLLPVQT